MKSLIRLEDPTSKERFYAHSLEDSERGEKYISVTTALDCVTPPMLKDYYKNNSKASIEKKLTSTANIGSLIHEYIEKQCKSEISTGQYEPYIIATLPAELQGPLFQWQLLKESYGIKPLLSEALVYHKKWGYAGTLDLVVEYQGKVCVADIKTGFYGVKAGWQIAAYKKALEEMIADGFDFPTPTGMIGLQVKRDGSAATVFSYEHLDFCFDRALDALGAYVGLNYKKLLAMNWPWVRLYSDTRKLGLQQDFERLGDKFRVMAAQFPKLRRDNSVINGDLWLARQLADLLNNVFRESSVIQDVPDGLPTDTTLPGEDGKVRAPLS